MRLNYRDIIIAYVSGSVASATTGYVIAGLWDHLGGNADYTVMAGGTWLLTVGVPSCLVAGDTIREKLGQKQRRVDIRASTSALGRTIRVNQNGRSSTIFASAIPLLGAQSQQAEEAAIDLPDTFDVWVDGVSHTFTKPELETFLYSAWNRQRAGKPGLSRKYWLREHRPRFSRVEYEATMALVTSTEGLVLNRDGGRSGKLSLPPQMAIRAIQGGAK